MRGERAGRQERSLGGLPQSLLVIEGSAGWAKAPCAVLTIECRDVCGGHAALCLPYGTPMILCLSVTAS